jgi:uncharacterized protein
MMNTEAPKPAMRSLPRFPEPNTQPFWEATKNHQLVYQVCDACATVVFYPRSHCTHCTSLALTWKKSAGVGAIYTYSVVRRSQHPAFRDLVPYAVAWVDLDEKFRLLTNIVGVLQPETELRIGQRVAVEWLDYDAVSLPVFRPV